jgi:hypothetical protein
LRSKWAVGKARGGRIPHHFTRGFQEFLGEGLLPGTR